MTWQGKKPLNHQLCYLIISEHSRVHTRKVDYIIIINQTIDKVIILNNAIIGHVKSIMIE